MARQQVTITTGASVFSSGGEMIGIVDRIRSDAVDVSGVSIPKSAFVRADDTGLHLDIPAATALAGRRPQGASTTSDVIATEQELMERSIEEARAIAPPPPAAGTQADPVAGSGFTRDREPGGNVLGDTTVSQPFEDLGEGRRNPRQIRNTD